MKNKPLKFSIYQLIIEGESPFSAETFSEIKDHELEPFDICRSKEEKETVSIKIINKNYVDERFICFYFNEGNKFPYSPTVIDTSDLQEKENPRSPEDIEMDDQFFVLIDIYFQRIYLSDQRRRGTLNSWLKEKIKKEIMIKSIINEEDFLSKLKTVNKIYFSVVPNLFNTSSEDILSHNLAVDIYGFEAEKAILELDYNDLSITEGIKNKFATILGRRSEFQEVTIIGRSEEGFESMFNLEEVVSRIVIDISTQKQINLLDSGLVFGLLISKIKSI